jgi:hypothetical protein
LFINCKTQIHFNMLILLIRKIEIRSYHMLLIKNSKKVKN